MNSYHPDPHYPQHVSVVMPVIQLVLVECLFVIKKKNKVNKKNDDMDFLATAHFVWKSVL